MTRLNEILDSMGKPPAEICLDWVWQIKRLRESKLDAPLTWSEIEVLDSGELKILASGNQDRTSAEELIAQLLSWSLLDEATPSDARTPQLPSQQTHLEKQTLAIVANPAAPQAESLPAASRKQLATTPAVGKASPLATRKSQNEAAAQAKRKHRKTTASQLRFAWLGGVALAAIGCISFLMWPKQSDSVAMQGYAEPPTSMDRRSREMSQTKSDVSLPAESAEILDVADSAALQLSTSALSTAAEPMSTTKTNADFNFPTTELAPEIRMQNMQPLDPVADSDTASTSSAEVESAAEITQLPETQQSETQLVNMERLESLAKSSVDVVAEMGRVTEEAEKLEQQSDVPDADATGISQPALLLSMSPMMQLQKPTTATAARVRKPEWQIRLVAGDGFQVSPPTAQVLTGREPTQWLISDEEGKDPQTKIGVTAILVNPRSPSIRWRIVAGAEDLPQVFVPMGKDYLDTMQRSLNQAGQLLNFQIEQLKAMGKGTGIPTAVRSAMAAQRREWESQLTISKRVLEIVADANQFERWMDGQIEMHAQLLDQATPDSTAVLQFGTLEEILVLDETEPKAEGASGNQPVPDVP